MSKAVKISVSITTYNHERFIRQAVQSVLQQKCLAQVEVIVGDDCSTDRTPEVLQELVRESSGRVKVIRPPGNLGGNGCPMFLETLKHCDGDFVAMLDGDDFWTSPDKLALQLAFFERHPKAALCHHAVDSVFEDGATEMWQNDTGAVESLAGFETLFPWHNIGSPAPMVRGEVIRSLPQWTRKAPFGDWPLYVRAAETGPIGYIPLSLAAYRFHAGGVWTQASVIERQQQAVNFMAAIDRPTMRRHRAILMNALMFHLIELARSYQEDGRLIDHDGHPMYELRGWEIDEYANPVSQPRSPDFTKAASWFFDQVGGDYQSVNALLIRRCQWFLHLELARYFLLRRNVKAGFVHGVRALRAAWLA